MTLEFQNVVAFVVGVADDKSEMREREREREKDFFFLHPHCGKKRSLIWMVGISDSLVVLFAQLVK